MTMTDAPATDVESSRISGRHPAAIGDGLLSDSTLEKMESWLDARFNLPGTNFRFGLDGLIGLVPGVGDAVTTSLSLLLVAHAYKMGARKHVLVKMGGNVAADFLVGTVPLVGDLFDFAFKSNVRNLQIIRDERDHLQRSAAANEQTNRT